MTKRQALPENPTPLDYIERSITEAMEAVVGAEKTTNLDLRADLLRMHAVGLIDMLNIRRGLRDLWNRQAASTTEV